MEDQKFREPLSTYFESSKHFFRFMKTRPQTWLFWAKLTELSTRLVHEHFYLESGNSATESGRGVLTLCTRLLVHSPEVLAWILLPFRRSRQKYKIMLLCEAMYPCLKRTL